MQWLLCRQDKAIDLLQEECARARVAFEKSDRLVSEALRREQNLEREMERLREETGEVPSFKAQLAEAQAKVSQLIAKGKEKDKEIESLQAAVQKNA